MKQVEIADAESDLRSLIEALEWGGEVVLAENGIGRARLTHVQSRKAVLRLGRLAGKVQVPPDFDAALPDDLLDRFEGK